MTAKTPAPKSKPAAKRAPVRAKVPAAAAAAPKVKAPKADAEITVAPPKKPVVEAVVAMTVPDVTTPDVTTPAPAAVQPAVAALPAAQPVTAAAAETAAPVTASTVISIATALNPLKLAKEPIMATAFESTTDAVKNTVNTLNAQTEAAVNNSKAAMEQVAAKSKEAVEASMKSLDELSDMTRANVDALIASARVATAGVEQVMTHLTEVSKKSFEETTAMVKGLAAAKTPNELMQLQSDFAKAQFDEAVAQYSKLSEMMVKLAGDVMEPVQNQVAVATDKMKGAFTVK